MEVRLQVRCLVDTRNIHIGWFPFLNTFYLAFKVYFEQSGLNLKAFSEILKNGEICDIKVLIAKVISELTWLDKKFSRLNTVTPYNLNAHNTFAVPGEANITSIKYLYHV